MQEKQSLPRHIAVIMDGNGRWAKQRGLPRAAGHKAGVDATRKVVETCARLGVPALTLFAFSSENWRRPQQEVGLLMDLFMRTLKSEAVKLNQNGVRLQFIGDRTALSSKLCERMAEAEQLTAGNVGLALNIAVNYGGRWDLAQAARQLAEEVARGRLAAEAVDAEAISSRLCLAGLPEPDLFIRTGGDLRISNFLLWQLAYTELYFTELLWPDFDAEALSAALDCYANRQRRFGRTGEQVEQRKHA